MAGRIPKGDMARRKKSFGYYDYFGIVDTYERPHWNGSPRAFEQCREQVNNPGRQVEPPAIIDSPRALKKRKSSEKKGGPGIDPATG